MNRRSLLAGVATAATMGFAGCRSPTQSEDPPQFHLEVTVQNNHDRAYDVRTVLTEADGGVAFEDSFRLAPGEGRGFGDDFPAGEYTVAVELSERNRVQSYWNTEFCDVHRVRTTIASDGHVTHDVACEDDGDG